MRIENKLCEHVKNMQGFILGIGIQSDSILEQIHKTESIKNCVLLGTETGGKGTSSSEIVNIRDFRKKWKRKRIDYIMADSKEILPYLKYFIKDSIYINKRKIYIFLYKKEEQREIIEIITKRYKRYSVKMETEKCKDGYIIEIENTDYKHHFLKDKFYYVIDTIGEWIDHMSDVLNG